MTQINNALSIIPNERIVSRIFVIRGKKVMLDRDLAELYGVGTKVLNQAVRRNMGRFPSDFMFQLTLVEHENLRSQFVTSNRGGRRYLPYAFTEHGILMLSSVINSEKAIQVNIQIMRSFVKLREFLISNEELRRKIEGMETNYDQKFAVIFQAIKHLLDEDVKPKREMGF